MNPSDERPTASLPDGHSPKKVKLQAVGEKQPLRTTCKAMKHNKQALASSTP
jgi:hypothetical protein